MNKNNNSKNNPFKRIVSIALSTAILGMPVVMSGCNIDKKSNDSSEIEETMPKKWHPTDAFVYVATVRGRQKAILYFKDGYKMELYDIRDPKFDGLDTYWINCADLFIYSLGEGKYDVENSLYTEGQLKYSSEVAIMNFSNKKGEMPSSYQEPDFMSDELYNQLYNEIAIPLDQETKTMEKSQTGVSVPKKWHPTDAFVYVATVRGRQKAILYFKDGYKMELYDIRDPKFDELDTYWINCADLFIYSLGEGKYDVENSLYTEGQLKYSSEVAIKIFSNKKGEIRINYQEPNFMSDELYNQLYNEIAIPLESEMKPDYSQSM